MLMLLAAIAVVLYLIHRFSPLIYDIVIVKMTSQWYKCVIQRLDDNARVLDIGIGTGSALACNAESGWFDQSTFFCSYFAFISF
jgi:hypothetical protein